MFLSSCFRRLPRLRRHANNSIVMNDGRIVGGQIQFCGGEGGEGSEI